jgi:PAS domain S-box-containing protein
MHQERAVPRLGTGSLLERLSRRITPPVAFALIGLALAAFVGLAVGSYREVSRELTDVAMARRLAVAQLAAATLSERLDRMVELGVSLATRVRFAELVAAGQWQPAAQILQNVPSQFRFIDRLVLYDAQGTLMADVPELPGVKGKNFAHRDWFQGVSRSWTPYVSDVYRRAAAPQRQVFAVAVPIADRGAGPTGILQLQVDLDSFFDWTRVIDLGAGGAAYVVDAKGTAAFHTASAVQDRLTDLSANPAVARLLQGRSGVEIAAPASGAAEHVYAFVPGRHGWSVVVEQPVSDAFAARENQLRRLFFGYGAILLFFVAGAGLAMHLLRQQRRNHALNLELEDLYNHAPCGYHSVDENGLIVRMNDTWLRWLGYSREEVIGKRRHADLMSAESAERFWGEAFPRFKREGRLDDAEFEYRRKDGSKFIASLNATIIYDRSGRYLMSRSTVFDVSARKRALTMHAERLRILSEIDRAMVAEQSPEAIAAAVIQPLRQLLGVPRAIVNRFDLDAGEVEWVAAAGRRRTHVGPGVRYSIRLMGDLDALRRGEPQLIDVDALPGMPETQALLASGVHVYMAVPMIAGGELLGALSFGGEKTMFTPEQVNIAQEVATQLAIAMRQARLLERVKGQAAELEVRVRERTAELEAANKELGSFSYSVSHDLRAPLRAIDGYARMLEEDYAARLDGEAARLLGVVRTSAKRMGQLIDDLLAFSRLGRQEPLKQRVDMTRIARDVGDELRGARERSMDFSQLPPAKADPALMRQVWLNLIGNALKYSAKQPDARIEVGGREETQENVYWVRDNGAGFDMRYAEKLFGVFQRLHRTEEFEGTGVGLAIVQRIVARHGGRVWAEGKPGEGACFYFSLPKET